MDVVWFVLAIVDLCLGFILIAGSRLYERKLWKYILRGTGIIVIFVGLVGLLLYV